MVIFKLQKEDNWIILQIYLKLIKIKLYVYNMDDLEIIKSTILEKLEKQEIIQRELEKIQLDIVMLDNEFNEKLYNHVFETNRDELLKQHKHYINNHTLKFEKDFYFYNKSKIIYIVCKECKVKCESAFNEFDDLFKKECEIEFQNVLLYDILYDIKYK